MADIEFSVDYNGTRESLLARLKGMEQKAQSQYADQAQMVQSAWRDDGVDVQGTVMGFDLSGKIDVCPTRADGGEVRVGITLPWALAMMKGPIEQQIRQEVTRMLSLNAGQ